MAVDMVAYSRLVRGLARRCSTFRRLVRALGPGVDQKQVGGELERLWAIEQRALEIYHEEPVGWTDYYARAVAVRILGRLPDGETP